MNVLNRYMVELLKRRLSIIGLVRHSYALVFIRG